MHRAIETRYSGYRFRSRLEARWAVFFDSLNLKWEYEPEGFELGEGKRYLPDFFIRFEPGHNAGSRHADAGYWLEIKPVAPTERECSLLLSVVKLTKHHGSILYGLPGENAPLLIRERRVKSASEEEALKLLTSRLPASYTTPFQMLLHSDFVSCTTRKMPSPDDVLRACAAARSARFEFGESGVRA